jgi:hypothetical protein
MNAKPVPFFVRYLEEQLEVQTDVKAGGSTAPLRDQAQTMKYPSDNEDGGGHVTLKYPSDNDEGVTS